VCWPRVGAIGAITSPLCGVGWNGPADGAQRRARIVPLRVITTQQLLGGVRGWRYPTCDRRCGVPLAKPERAIAGNAWACIMLALDRDDFDPACPWHGWEA
jgi:hypothetical protein